MPIRQITIIGTGLIGGSLALALRKKRFRGKIIGCDQPDVLRRAKKIGAIDKGIGDPIKAAEGSDVVVIATPVGTIIDLIERLGLHLSDDVRQPSVSQIPRRPSHGRERKFWYRICGCRSVSWCSLVSDAASEAECF